MIGNQASHDIDFSSVNTYMLDVYSNIQVEVVPSPLGN